MGLDAVVCCNCFETGMLKEPPPDGLRLCVSADGYLECDSEELELGMRFDQWRLDRACEHENGVLLDHYLGNTATVAAIREELSHRPITFSLILEKVVYSGTHCGDWLDVTVLEELRTELRHLDNFACDDPLRTDIVDHFRQQMQELVEAAVAMNKPIAF